MMTLSGSYTITSRPVHHCTIPLCTFDSRVSALRNTTSFHWICRCQSVRTLTDLSTRLELHAGAYKKPVRDMAQKQRLVEVQADSEQTNANKAIDQQNKQAFVKAKAQHLEHSLFMISCIVWTDEMF